jgi:CBS domain-containing protein
VFTRIVVGIDGSQASEAALEIAMRVAAAFSSHLTLVAVVEESPPYVSVRREGQREQTDARAYYEKVLRAALGQCQRRGVSAESRIRDGNEVRALLEATTEDGADLLAVGNAGHSGVWGSGLGSTAARLAELAPVSVLISRVGTGTPPARILAGYDGSDMAKRATDTAGLLARAFASHLIVAAPKEIRDSIDPRVATGPLMERLEASVAVEIETIEGDPGPRLVDLARRLGQTLVVVGSIGRSHPWSRGLGPTATYLAEHAPGTVLLVRSPDGPLVTAAIMRRHVVSASPETPLADAARSFVNRGVKCLPIVDEAGQLVGILTFSDLLRRARLSLRPSMISTLTHAEVDAIVNAVTHAGGTCGDAMTRDLATAREGDPLSTLLTQMAERRVKRLPVVTGEGRMVGIVSRSDVIRALAGAGQSPDVAVRRHITGRVASDVMRTDIVPLRESEALEQTVHAVVTTSAGRVAVVDERNRVVGVIAVRDLLPLATAGSRPQLIDALAAPSGRIETFIERLRSHADRRTARDVMRRDVVTVQPTTPLAEVLALMIDRALKGILVVDDERRLVGLVERAAIVEALAPASGAPA